MIRFGIIGPGGIAHKFAQDIKDADNAELVAVASRDIEKANKFKEQYHIKLAFGSYLELCQSNEIDAIYIASPHVFHKEHAIMAMKHKKHVLVEKPIVVNECEMNELIRIKNENNVVLMEAMWSRFLPVIQEIKGIIDAGKIGKIIEYEADFSYELDKSYDPKGRLLNPDLAGGTILDLGVYPVSIGMYFIKEPIISVVSNSILSEESIDLQNESVLKTKSDVVLKVSSSMIRNKDHTAMIKGTKGTINIINFSRSEAYYMNDILHTMPMTKGGFAYQIEQFSNTILNHEYENKIMPLNESKQVISILELMRKKSGVTYPFE